MEKFIFRARPDVFVPLEALEMHGSTEDVKPEEPDRLDQPSVLWRGAQKECGLWQPVSAMSTSSDNGHSSDTITNKELRYLKEFRQIVESNAEPLEQTEQVNQLVNTHNSDPMIREKLLDDPLARYYKGILQNINGVGEKTARTLFNFGFWSPKMLAEVSREELTAIPGIGEKTARKVLDGAEETTRTAMPV